jgi:hypothetical protein
MDAGPERRPKAWPWVLTAVALAAIVAGYFYSTRNQIGLAQYLDDAYFEGVRLVVTGDIRVPDQDLGAFRAMPGPVYLDFEEASGDRGAFKMTVAQHEVEGQWSFSGDSNEFVNLWIDKIDGKLPDYANEPDHLMFRPPRYVDDPFVVYSLSERDNVGRNSKIRGIYLLRNVGERKWWRTEDGAHLRPSRKEIILP